MKFHECFCLEWVLEGSGFPLEILPLSKVPELCAARDGLEGTLCSLCFSQISLRFLGHQPTSRRHLDPPAAGSWSCQGNLGSLVPLRQKRAPQLAFSLCGAPRRVTRLPTASPTDIVHSMDEPQLQKLLLKKVTSPAAAAPGTAGAHPRFLCFVSSTKRPRVLFLVAEEAPGPVLVAEEATRCPTLVREDPR